MSRVSSIRKKALQRKVERDRRRATQQSIRLTNKKVRPLKKEKPDVEAVYG